MNNPFQDIGRTLNHRHGDAIPDETYVARARKGNAIKSESRYPVVENPWGLSPAQCAVMKALLELHTLQAAADALGMAKKTAANHAERVRNAMDSINTLQAVLIWDRHWREQQPNHNRRATP